MTEGVLARHRVLIACLGLVLATAGLYWPVTHHDFINVDDPRFVTENSQVQAGLTWSGAVWALHSVYTESWQPVTWLSHMLDCQLWGLNAGGHHLTSLLFHLANTVLVFLWLRQITQAFWRSACVAALFALHPLHVESVAWICERKDVLSAFFWLLALLAYTRYARRPQAGWYALLLVLFALGLMSKPMVVTLPCVLLLLDFWPFNRLRLNFCGAPAHSDQPAPFAGPGVARRILLLVAEKIPFFLLVLGMIAATLFAQKEGGSLGSLAAFPLATRLATALVSYFKYLTTTFWPVDLAYVYPYASGRLLATAVAGGVLVVVWTICCVARARRQPWLLVGWLWFLGTLVPTIGLIQFCLQARADRYMYLPSIGLFIVVVWGTCDLLDRWPARRVLLPMLGGLALIGCATASAIQLSYWQNSITVARHAIAVTEGNFVAYESVGRAVAALGQPQRAIDFFAEASRLAPTWPQGQFNYGLTLAQIGDTNGAIQHLQTAVNLVPGYPEGRCCLGMVLLKFGQTDEAVQQFAEAARLDPGSANTEYQWGTALAREKKTVEAVTHFSEALRLRPDFPQAKAALDQVRSPKPNP
ncbi:MAG: tetratricopeptide repeat protein [Verrucomicrobiota bacterium]